jgi:hypothetical protein
MSTTLRAIAFGALAASSSSFLGGALGSLGAWAPLGLLAGDVGPASRQADSGLSRSRSSCSSCCERAQCLLSADPSETVAYALTWVQLFVFVLMLGLTRRGRPCWRACGYVLRLRGPGSALRNFFGRLYYTNFDASAPATPTPTDRLHHGSRRARGLVPGRRRAPPGSVICSDSRTRVCPSGTSAYLCPAPAQR